MAYKNKYRRQKKQYSTDSGATWTDVYPAEYRKGELLEEASADCNTVTWNEVADAWYCIGNEDVYRWVQTEDTECYGNDRYYVEREEKSDDGGLNWAATGETRNGNVYGYDSDDCGQSADFSKQYFTIESVEDGNTIGFESSTVLMSRDLQNWSTFADSGEVTLDKGEKAYFKRTVRNVEGSKTDGILTVTKEMQNGSLSWTSTAKVKVYGNILSLYVGDNFTDYTIIQDKSDIYVNCEYMFSRGRYMWYPSNELPYQINNVSDIDVVSVRNLYFPEGIAYNARGMFSDQTNLTNVPKTCPFGNWYRYVRTYVWYTSSGTMQGDYMTASNAAYIFKGCTSLKTADTTFTGSNLARLSSVYNSQEGHYREAFMNCTSLVSAPVLESTIVPEYAYYGCFRNCTHLTEAPVLKAVSIGSDAYDFLFYECSNLHYIKCLVSETAGFTSWTTGVPMEGRLVRNPECRTWRQWSDEYIPYRWELADITANYTDWRTVGYECVNDDKYELQRKYISEDGELWLQTGETRTGSLIERDSADCMRDYSADYFTVQALGSGNIRIYSRYTSGRPGYLTDLYYSLNDGEWTSLSLNTDVTVSEGDMIKFKSNGLTDSGKRGTSAYGYSTSGSTSYQWHSIKTDFDYNVFGNVKSLIYSDDFTTYDDTNIVYQFINLFFPNSQNAHLISAKNLVLPQNLDQHAFDGMFYLQSKMTTAPKLKATVLSDYCYYYMFSGCSGLASVPELPATTLTTNCYNGMFQNCTTITKSPVLPATTLVQSCYNYMFDGCTNLTEITAMFTTTPEYGGYTYYWVRGVASSGTFYKNSEATWDVTGNDGIPSGWTVVTE